MKKRRRVKIVLTALSASALACSNAGAAMLDLAGTDMTVADVADLASYDGVTNSSATAVTPTGQSARVMCFGRRPM